MPQPKMTVKDLAAEVENLKHVMEEKDNLVNNLEKKFENLQLWAHGCFTDICDKINESSKQNIDNGKVIETKFNDVETKVDNLLKVKTKQCEVDIIITEYKCRECEEKFENRSLLKKHILNLHPKYIKCEYCSLEFNENWKLEEHMSIHGYKKTFSCDLCDKRFVLKWRLKKHINSHQQSNIKFCHFFNNNKICNYEQVSGCMFKHDAAPLCKYSKNFGYKLCQFRHE